MHIQQNIVIKHAYSTKYCYKHVEWNDSQKLLFVWNDSLCFFNKIFLIQMSEMIHLKAGTDAESLLRGTNFKSIT